VVGIGASAGGLDALERLFSELPADSGLAFVVVQHQDPRHPNTLANLLGRCTRMPVSKAQDRVRPEPNQVYAMAPKTLLSVQGGALRVAASSEGASAGRIDAFLSSLAKDRGENAAGVVLSGAGSDGIAGLRAIKERGGRRTRSSRRASRTEPSRSRRCPRPWSRGRATSLSAKARPEPRSTRIWRET